MGGFSNTYSMQNHGTTIQTTARIEQDGTIVLELQAERVTVGDQSSGRRGSERRQHRGHQDDTGPREHHDPRSQRQTGHRRQPGVGRGKEAIHTYFVLTATVPEDARQPPPPRRP